MDHGADDVGSRGVGKYVPITVDAQGFRRPVAPVCDPRARILLADDDEATIGQDERESIFRGMREFTYRRGRDEMAELVEPLMEPDSMTIVASPFHDFEPASVPDGHTGTLNCRICGSARSDRDFRRLQHLEHETLRRVPTVKLDRSVAVHFHQISCNELASGFHG